MSRKTARTGCVTERLCKPEHLPVFDCAFKPYRGKRSIHYLAHLKMMAAAQPFISGAISKTVNMPNECTVEEIRDTYVQAWKMGLKCVAIYRDGSKRSQPLNTKKTNDGGDKTAAAGTSALEARIKELEAEVIASCAPRPASRCAAACPTRARPSRTNSTSPATKAISPSACLSDGQPGELFITMAKEGSTIGGLMDSIGTLTSMALQYGVPLEALVRKFAHQRFEPSGFTKNPEIRNAASITDYVFRWMALQFIPGYREAAAANARQPELAMPGLLEEEKKRVNRPVPELAMAEDTDVMDVKEPGNGKATIASPARPHGEISERLHRALPAGRADVPELRPRRRAQRRLLQMPELRRKPRLLLRNRKRNRPGDFDSPACLLLLWPQSRSGARKLLA